MTDELEVLLEQFSPEEGESDLLDWLEVPTASSRGEKARQDRSGQDQGEDKSSETAGRADEALPTETAAEPEPESQADDPARAEEDELSRLRQAGETATDEQRSAKQTQETEESAGRLGEQDGVSDVSLLKTERQTETVYDEVARAVNWSGEDAGAASQAERRESGADAGGLSSGKEDAGAAETAESLAGELDELTRRELGQSAQALYRQVVRAGTLTGATGGQPGRTVVTERVTTGAPSLTADELDRAVRRDSRRYDGGMELY
jgi:hypothetical protein